MNQNQTVRYICRTNEISRKKPFVFQVSEMEQLVVFQSEGEYYAVENRCPHAGAFLHEGLVEKRVLTCIWHGWRFDLESGQSLDEYWARLKTYPILVREGKLYLAEVDSTG